MDIVICVLLWLICAAAAVTFVVYCLRTVRQQIKLYHSIQLVILRRNRTHFLIMACLAFALFVFCLVGAASRIDFFYDRPYETYGIGAVMMRISYVMLSLFSAAATAVFVVLFVSKCAIVDRGIQLPGRLIDWHRLYYYYVDEIKYNVIISLNKKGPYTLMGLHGPYKFDRIDLEKLKFILNKNRNKFLTHYDVR